MEGVPAPTTSSTSQALLPLQEARRGGRTLGRSCWCNPSWNYGIRSQELSAVAQNNHRWYAQGRFAGVCRERSFGSEVCTSMGKEACASPHRQRNSLSLWWWMTSSFLQKFPEPFTSLNLLANAKIWWKCCETRSLKWHLHPCKKSSSF